MVLHDVLAVLQQSRQVRFGGLAATAAEGVQTGHAGLAFTQGFADGVASPAEQLLRLSLTETKRIERVGHVAASLCSQGQPLCGADDQVTHLWSKVHVNPSSR